MDNYDYCARWAREQGGRVLDYGCGAGHIVRKFRELGLDGYGCDVFYGGNFERRFENRASDIAAYVSKIDGGVIPYEDASFDAVISNQVFEHVTDLDQVLREVARVLRPGGKLLALFPDKSIWREGHCELPFLHWFPKGRTRVYYAATLRALGAGANKADFPGVMHWARSFCEWIDNWTHYLPPAEVDRLFRRYFTRTDRMELEWLSARLEGKPLHLVPASVRLFATRKLICGRVMEAVR